MITLLVAIFFGAATLSSAYECDPKTIPSEKIALKPMNFPEKYKVSGVISDWIKKSAVGFIEVADTDRISTFLSFRNDSSLQWLTLKAEGNTFLYNKTSGHCDKTSSSCLESFPELLSVAKNLSSLATLVKGLVDFSSTNKGFLRGNKSVAGIKGVHWVSCVNGTNGSANLQVDVVFASENSMQTPSSAFDNPLVLLLQVGVYRNLSDNSSLMSQFAVEFDSYSSISEDDSRLFLTPPGVVCSGWKQKRIPLNVSDPYNVHIQLIDERKIQYDSMVHYSASQGVIAVSGARKNDIVPFINEKNVPKEVISVVHDFNTGYEYGLGNSRCVLLSALPTDSDDVIIANATYSMRPVMEMLIPTELSFGNYGVLKSEDGRTIAIYRGLNIKTNEALELHFDGDQLDSYTAYKIIDGSPFMSSYTKFTRAPNSGVSSLLEKMRACFAVHDRINDILTLTIKSKSLKDVYEQGVDKVTSALADALSNIAPINPLRVRLFFGSGTDNTLRVFFSVEEKSDVKPATVPKYNYTAEVPSSVLVERLNGTISKGDWKFLVSNPGEKPEEWVVMGKSLERYTPSSSGSLPGYVGYTGGAMFVLGVFTLILGVSIGASAVFFVTRRQRISTLAYQVFE